MPSAYQSLLGVQTAVRVPKYIPFNSTPNPQDTRSGPPVDLNSSGLCGPSLGQTNVEMKSVGTEICPEVCDMKCSWF